ncbi:MAG: vWA domain-containing protein [Dichotomicrobium sp.]
MTTAASGNSGADIRANIVAAEIDGGRIADNIVMFARLLRAAGLPAGPDKTALATEAVLAVGIDDPKRFYWTLHAVFVSRRVEHDIFNQAFVMFWRDPGFLDQLMSLMLPTARSGQAPDDKALSRRMAEALFASRGEEAPRHEEQVDLRATGSWSDRTRFQDKDFEQMSAAELRETRRQIAALALPFERLRSRRFAPVSAHGRLDLRRMLRDMAARGPDYLRPAFRRRRWVRPPIVVLCDISGSMDTYARVFLHFIYALTNDRDRVHAFLFGTELTPVSRLMKDRDPDAALARVSAQVRDWAGGTRIGDCLQAFNRDWARRISAQNATVLLFTDGLDRAGGEGIGRAARKLAANSRRLIWLNPLLRSDDYAPLAQGAQALAPHVDEIRRCHNLNSLSALAEALAGDGPVARRTP